VSGREAVEEPLDLRLLDGVEARPDPVGRPALVDAAVLRPRRVGADRGGVDERGDAGLCDRAEDALRPGDVHPPEQVGLARGLDQPGEVDDAVGAAEVGDEVVAGHVRGRPFDVLEPELGQAARDPQHRVAGERADEARADVAGRADDDDPHHTACSTPSSSTSVKYAFA
jgi:hypothetical protein